MGFSFLRQRYLNGSNSPDGIVFDVMYLSAWPFCRAPLRCVALVANTPTLELAGFESDLHPALINDASEQQLRESFAARLKNFVLVRVLRYALPLVRAALTWPCWRDMGHSWPRLSTEAGRSVMLITNAAVGIAPASSSGPLLQFTGPWLPRASPGLSESVERFLNASVDGFVYISIGTNAEWDCNEGETFLMCVRVGR